MKYLALAVSVIGLVGQVSAQSCTNGAYACVAEGSSPDFKVCNNNAWVTEPGPSGQVCCMIGSDPKFFPGSCPGGQTQPTPTANAGGPSPKSGKTTTNSPTPSPTKSSPPPSNGGKGFTVTSFGTLFGGALEPNACGISGSDPAVAVNPSWFNTANPNLASICGKTVVITANGKTVNARAVDKCTACGADNHLDMTSGLFFALGGTTASGHVASITYTISGWSPAGNAVDIVTNTIKTNSTVKAGGKKSGKPSKSKPSKGKTGKKKNPGPKRQN